MIAALLLAVAPVDPIAGTWEGTSLCQVHPSSCHDEHVVYHVTRPAAGLYRVAAYKVVGGEEQFMGTIDFRVDAAAHQLSGSNVDRSGVSHPWLFTVKGGHISGKALAAPG